jgi:ABC-2 type transport system permease protein
MTAICPAQGQALAPWLAFQSRLTANEVAKGLRLMWRRRSMVVAAGIAYSLLYLGITLFIGGGHIVKPLMTLTLPALLAATVAVIAALQGVGGISEEINGGTLEQSLLGPAAPELQALGRLAALAIEGVAVAAVFGTAFTLSFGLHFHLNPGVVIPAVLTVAAALGYGLLVTALTVRVASIGAVTHVFNMAVMYFGGMLVPVTLFPQALETFSSFLPITLGVEALNTTLAGKPLSAAWADGTLPWLLVYATVSLTLGLAIYSVNIHHARAEGGLRPG